MIDAEVIIKPLAYSGCLSIIATTGAKRNPSMPSVPAIAEAGFPDYQVAGWICIMAPAGTPTGILTLLHSSIADSLREGDVQQQLKRMGMTPLANSPADFARELVDERARWKRLIGALNLKLD